MPLVMKIAAKAASRCGNPVGFRLFFQTLTLQPFIFLDFLAFSVFPLLAKDFKGSAKTQFSLFFFGIGKRGLLEKGSFQKSPFARDSGEFRDSRDSREPPDYGKKRESDHFLEIQERF